MRLGYKGTITKRQIILSTPKNPYLNQATQKIPAKIFLPKKIPKSKFSNLKRSFNLPCHLKSGVPPGAVFNIAEMLSTPGKVIRLSLRDGEDFKATWYGKEVATESLFI